MPELEKRLTLFYVEPIGTGASDRLPAGQHYGIKTTADQLEQFRAALQLGSMCLIGHSYAGAVVLRFAIDHPDRVSPLIVYDGIDRFGDDFVKAIEANVKWFEGKSWYKDAAAALLGPDATTDPGATEQWARVLPLYFDDFDAHADEYTAASRVPVSVAPMSARDPAEAKLDLRPELGAIIAPTLVLVGKRDFVTSEPFAREIAAGVRGARLIVLEHSGHMGHLEEPARFAQVVGDFVDGLGRR
jgi:proline iminopeptidase